MILSIKKFIKLMVEDVKGKERLVEQARLERERYDEERYMLEFSKDPTTFVKGTWILRNMEQK